MLELKVENGSFVDSQGKEITYKKLYVEVFGEKVYLQAKDRTGQQFVLAFLSKGGK